MKLCRILIIILNLSLSGFLTAQITVKADMDHLDMFGGDTIGNIYLNVNGGTSPYSYTWTPGSYTAKDYTNIPQGDYTVHVVDNNSNYVNYYYSLGYKTDWFDFYGLMFRNDSVMSDGTMPNSNQTAISKNTLPDSTDGWCQFVIPTYSNPYVVGFLDSVSEASKGTINDMDFGFHLTTGNTLYCWTNSNWYYIGPATAGDVMKLARIGGTYYLFKNGTSVITNTAPFGRKLKIKVNIYQTWSMGHIGTSFNDTSSIDRVNFSIAGITHVMPLEEDTLGSINIDVKGGTPPYTYSWKPTAYSEKDYLGGVNDFTVTVKDADNDSTSRVVSLGYKSLWYHYWGTYSNNDTLWANAAQTPSGSPTAYSINELRPNQSGWIQYVVEEFSSPYVIGFSDSIMEAYRGGVEDINFAMHQTYSNALYGWNGYWNYLGTVYQGDIMKIVKDGNAFILYKNDVAVFSANAVDGHNYKVKANLNDYIHRSNIGVSFKDSTSSYPLRVIGKVDHIDGDGIDSTGSINIELYGGKTPYTYEWSLGVGDRNVKDIAAGTYTVKVKDYKNDSLIYAYTIGYDAKWSNFYGTELHGDSLIVNRFTYPTDSFPTARIIDSLAQDSSGWCETVLRNVKGDLVFGFLDSAYASSGSYYDIDFAWHISYNANKALYVWDRGNWYFIHYSTPGEVLRIERDGSYYKLSSNGNLVYSVGGVTNKALQIKARLNGPPYGIDWPTIVGAGVGWITRCNTLNASITNSPEITYPYPEPVSLNCNVTGGNPPYSVVWTPNVYFNSPSYSNTQLSTQVVPPISLTYLAAITDGFGCKKYSTITVIAAPYAPLNKIPDGGYYKLTNNKLLFKFDGQYATTGLVYNVYNKLNDLVTSYTSVNSSVVISGDNRYSLDASSLAQGYYTLEIVNEKKEKLYVRFIR